MFTRILLGLLVAFPFVLQAGSDITPLNVKLGLWETTATPIMSGMPSIPDSQLAQMPPDQRAKVEEMLKKMSGQPITSKSCMTKDKLEKSEGFRNAPKSCTYTIVSSTSSKLELKMECAQNGGKMTGDMRVDVVDSGNVKGSMHMTSSAGTNGMNINTTFTSKWLGADCGSVQ